jgi:hypothetical protein
MKMNISSIEKAEEYLDLLDRYHDVFFKISEHIEVQRYDRHIPLEELRALLEHSFERKDIDLYMQYVYPHNDIHQWVRNLQAELENLGFGSIKSLVSSENRKEFREILIDLQRKAS